jgi:SanA protein
MFFLLKFLVAFSTLATVSWVFVEARGRRRVFDKAMELPGRGVALVLGCAPLLEDGRPNRFYQARMDAAAEAYRASRCRMILVSGSYGLVTDEPGAMKASLIELGVPEAHIVEDRGGHRTFESMYRARDVYGLTSVLIISQRFHNLRAICIADRLKLQAVALNATHPRGGSVIRMMAREIVSRFRMMFELYPFVLPRDYGAERAEIELP